MPRPDTTTPGTLASAATIGSRSSGPASSDSIASGTAVSSPGSSGAPRPSPTTASAASWVVNVLVAGTACSTPAAVTNATSAASASGDDAPPLVIASVRAPQAL